ncbi:3'-5' exonuclease [Streptomyces sp. TRM43335]|uniref:3'-5' exonuclease n=2 Tax=Streptomyces taklimakanensis TaxID=2569853 RepID=A0A6G2BDM9_9ACTN|nr:3'-5' exonuclease [Streptomyces taklimakanensis]
MTGWHNGPLLGFDTETTGTNITTDRIVTACLVHCGTGRDTATTTWLSDVDGVEIPAEATKVHGVSTAKAHSEGLPAASVIRDLVTELDQAADHDIPIVVMNAPFDLGLLEHEARRHGITPLSETAGDRLRVIDPRVLDKHADRYRRGGRTLTDLCDHYDVKLGDAHTADADALAACRVAWRIAQRHPQLAALTLDELHEQQTHWHAQQAASLRNYFTRAGKTTDAADVRTDWPLVPHQEDS